MGSRTEALRVLGLGPGAGPEQITRAYRALARAWHPDANPDPASPARLAEIVAAYRLLRPAAQDRIRPQQLTPERAPARSWPMREPARPRGATVVAGPVRIHTLPGD